MPEPQPERKPQLERQRLGFADTYLVDALNEIAHKPDPPPGVLLLLLKPVGTPGGSLPLPLDETDIRAIWDFAGHDIDRVMRLLGLLAGL